MTPSAWTSSCTSTGETIPYIAGWAEDGALEAVTEQAELIDQLARRIEDVLAVAEHEAGDLQLAVM